MITGDLMHHPVQCAEPGWASNFDVDADEARKTRRGFLENYKDGNTLVLGTHFAAPTSGWHRLGFPDTFDSWDDDIGGVQWKGSGTVLSSSARR